MRTALAAAALLVATLPASASDDYRHGRFRQVEGSVSVQGGEDTASEEATRHLPYLPGDRVWTDRDGRVEFQFADGSVIRLDQRSKLDYVEHVEGREERVSLRLWSGSLFLRSRGRQVAWEVETPSGLVSVDREAVVRVDAVAGEARVSVYEGEALFDAGNRRATLTAGMRTFAERGYAAAEAEIFDRAEDDPFAAWNASLDDRRDYAGEQYLPDDVAVYGADLEGHGAWEYETEVGYVWRPHVAVSWQPYRDGRWVYTTFGWTWVPSEPWGWAPFHYGRWGYSGRGWYWVPGRTWSPAWVSWSIGSNYIGWSALGHRPHRSRGDYAVPRGRSGHEPQAWNYVRRTDLGARDVARRRVDGARIGEEAQRLIDSPGVRLGRNLEPTDASRASSARPRSGRGPAVTTSRPTIGDSVPELRDDPATSIPTPRTRRRGEVERRQNQADRPATGGAVDLDAPAARPRTWTSGEDRAADPSWSSRGVRRQSPRTPPVEANPPDGGTAQAGDERSTRRRGDTPESGAGTSAERPRGWWRTPRGESEPSPRSGGSDGVTAAEPRRDEPAAEARPRRGRGDDSVERFLRSLSSPRRRGGDEAGDATPVVAPRERDEQRSRERSSPRGYSERRPERERSEPQRVEERRERERPEPQRVEPRQERERPRPPRAEPRREREKPPAAQATPSSSSSSGRARHRNRDN